MVYHLTICLIFLTHSLLQYDIWGFFSEILTIWNELLTPGPYLMVFREAGQLCRFTQTSLRMMLGTMCFKYITGDCSFEMLQGPQLLLEQKIFKL